jgi:hypothetical protein
VVIGSREGEVVGEGGRSVREIHTICFARLASAFSRSHSTTAALYAHLCISSPLRAVGSIPVAS